MPPPDDVEINFEWDPRKAAANQKKHGVSFEEAASVFKDIFSLTIPDPLHSEEEDRIVTLGMSYFHRLVVVSHTERDDRVRIISARKASQMERDNYEQGIKV